MKFKFLGCEIYVSFLFCALITVMIAFDKTGLIVPTLCAVLFHEMGHLFCMWLEDIAPKRIKLIPSSVQITSDITARYKTDIKVSLFGPLVNFFLFIVLYINFYIFKNQITLIFSLINLIIGCFNLLPLKGLDGGRVIYSIIASKKDIAKANLALKAITLIFSVILIFVSVFLSFRKIFNPSLYIIALYFFILSLAKE